MIDSLLSRVPRAAAALALVVVALGASPATAQEPPERPLVPPPPLAIADGALYVGDGGTGRPLLLSLLLSADGTAQGTLLEAPPPRGAAPGLDFAFQGRHERSEETVRVEATARPRTTAGAPQHVVIEAPRVERSGHLDPFASAVVTVGTDLRLELHGAGTVLDGELTLTDTSFGMALRSPFFYAEPWNDLKIDALAREDAADSLRDGLAQRRGLPEAVSGMWWDRRYATVEAFGTDLVSVRVLTDVYSGGAHPNTWRATRTFVRDGEGWRPVGLCDALAALDRECGPDAIREATIEALRLQEAAWVLDGTVGAAAPWLLDLFTLTPRGLRLEFDPYAVGPYAEGPFVVDLEFPLPGE